MVEELREQMVAMEGLVPDVARIAAGAMGALREELESNGFTREEAMALLVAQASSGEPIVKLA